MNLSAAKQGLADVLGGVSGLRGFAQEPSQISPPSAWVTNSTIDYRLDMSYTGMRVTFRVTIALASGVSEKAQEELDDYLATEGTKSIVAALLADHTLGGTVDFVDAVAMEDAGLIEVGGSLYVGARMLVEAVG
jgi:hypothetical protein